MLCVLKCHRLIGPTVYPKMSSHILSFLPIRRIVSTSILSKRWANIWRNVSTLIFIDFLYGQKAYFLFNEFVYSLLLSRNYIKSFTFRIGYDYPRFGLFLFQISSNGSMLWYNTEFSTSIFPKWMLILTCLLAFWVVEPLLFLNVTESLWMWRGFLALHSPHSKSFG